MSLGRPIKFSGIILAVIFSMSLAACNAGTKSKEKQYPGSRSLPKAKYGTIYTVKRGDTLYSIAWAIKQDFRKVAAWNGIRSPYIIHTGQPLRMYPPSQNSAKKSTSSSSRSASYSTTHAKASVKSGAYTDKSPQGRVKRWIWPTISRKIASRFQPAVGKDGIDISGKFGDPVFATADGQVVYAGSGLRGYGKLIILKHNKTYLSAYAHNDSILVVEGQNIRAGKKIGKVGSSSAGYAGLHFEIRKNGKPVDPVKYLSSR